MGPLSFDAALPRLVAAYDRGMLVPFLGAGMSRDACPTWRELVDGLEKKAPSYSEAAKANDGGEHGKESHHLIQRVSRAVGRLRRQHADAVSNAVHAILYQGKAAADSAGGSVPAQTSALAKIWWPLVITTNYDDLFATEYLRARTEEWRKRTERSSNRSNKPTADELLLVLGRGEQDLQRVLSSLTTTDRSILWALQGFLPRAGASSHPLARQVVVGHEEYRRATHVDQHFRRAFAEVFRRRSFLFLGAGLSEPYFLDLFNEVLEFFGPNPHLHYALASPQDNLNVAFLRARFNIIVVEYGSHELLAKHLDRFRVALDEPRAFTARWGYRFDQPRDAKAAAAMDDLTIVHGRLPNDLRTEARACVAVSAGLDDGKLYLSDGIRDYANSIYKGFDVQARRVDEGKSGAALYAVEKQAGCAEPIVAVSAWLTDTQRDLRLIGEAMNLALDWAAANGFTHMHIPLLAAGNSRHFHPRFSLVEMIRGYARWRRAWRERRAAGHESRQPPRLTIHLIDLPAVFELTSGRLDTLELLAMRDVRFWIEVVPPDGRAERELTIRADGTTIDELAAELDLTGAWHVEVEPSPTPGAARRSLPDVQNWSIARLGVLPGSTLRFTAVQPGADIGAPAAVRRQEQGAHFGRDGAA